MEMGTREKIMEAARKEFALRGLEGARVDRIASQAGVNKAMIYYHFRSKDNLYSAIIEEHIERIGQFWEGAIAVESDPETLIRRATEYYNSFALSSPGYVPILLREIAGGGEVFKGALTKVIVERKLISKMQKMIESGIADGRFRDVDSKQAMLSFLGMNLFYLMMAPLMNKIWEIDDEQKFRQERPREIAELYLYGLKKR